jgi:hypothetical protein
MISSGVDENCKLDPRCPGCPPDCFSLGLRASFSVCAQTDPRRAAGGYCGYLTPAGLATLSFARSSCSSAPRGAGSRRSVPRATLVAAGYVRLAAPVVLAASYSLLAARPVLLRSSCPYFTGFDTVWQVPSGPGQLLIYIVMDKRIHLKFVQFPWTA